MAAASAQAHHYHANAADALSCQLLNATYCWHLITALCEVVTGVYFDEMQDTGSVKDYCE